MDPVQHTETATGGMHKEGQHQRSAANVHVAHAAQMQHVCFSDSNVLQRSEILLHYCNCNVKLTDVRQE